VRRDLRISSPLEIQIQASTVLFCLAILHRHDDGRDSPQVSLGEFQRGEIGVQRDSTEDALCGTRDVRPQFGKEIIEPLSSVAIGVTDPTG
jgi:hypothetical protein